MFRTLKSRRLSTLLARDPKFKKLCEADVHCFREIVGDAGVVHKPGAPHQLEAYNLDWMRRYRGQSELVLRPESNAQVSEILKYCNAQKIAVVPQGGNTGLVGGSVPLFDEVIVNLSRMRRVREFDAASGTLIAEAGCVLESLDQNLRREHGHMMPVDLGAKGSCMLGGMIATNAGGIRVLRHGSMRANMLGVEAVIADGSSIDELKPCLKKNNVGLHLPSLFTGSEGTLGIITAAAIAVPRVPEHTSLVLLLVSQVSGILKTWQLAQSQLGASLSAFEFWDQESAALLDKKNIESGKRSPFAVPANKSPNGGPFHVLVEVSGGPGIDDQLESFLDAAAESSVIVEGTMAQDSAQEAYFWSLRESITEACQANNKVGPNLKYDVSLPTSRIYDLVPAVRRLLADRVPENQIRHVLGFGHFGDGNLHLNVGATQESTQKVLNSLEPFIYEWIAENNGSISAEHGIGQMKRNYLSLSRPPAAISVLRRIKDAFDPNGILNPYKLLPDPS